MQTLEIYLNRLARRDLAAAILPLAEAAHTLHEAIRAASVPTGSTDGANASGETQKPLDVYADELFLNAARSAPIWLYGSEEQDEPVATGSGTFALTIDPLDGSSNIETNIAVGTIFSLFAADASAGAEAALTQKGSEQTAAGFFIYGAQLLLIFTAGEGTHSFIFEPQGGGFRHLAECKIPAQSREYSINAANRRHWDAGLRRYIEDLEAGTDGPRRHDFGMRYAGSLVADAYRILQRGGVFIYPSDRRKAYENGRLRQLYEANPVAFCIEQAGGAASDLTYRLLDLEPGPLHAKVPFAFGSRDEIETIARYIQPASSPALLS